MVRYNTTYGYYTLNENNQYHSENDEPAIVEASRIEYEGEDNIEIHIDGYKAWYKNGRLHREEGPAVIRDCGTKFYYLNGQLIREEN